jgi:hypothetical protein
MLLKVCSYIIIIIIIRNTKRFGGSNNEWIWTVFFFFELYFFRKLITDLNTKFFFWLMAIYQFCFGLDKEIFFPHLFEWEWEILKNVEIPLSLGFRCNFLFHGIICYSDNFACAIIGEYVEMVKAGIIDSFKVIRTAMVDAARWSSPSFGKSLCVPVP